MGDTGVGAALSFLSGSPSSSSVSGDEQAVGVVWARECPPRQLSYLASFGVCVCVSGGGDDRTSKTKRRGVK